MGGYCCTSFQDKILNIYFLISRELILVSFPSIPLYGHKKARLNWVNKKEVTFAAWCFKKRRSENMHQIHSITLMPKCDFQSTSTWLFSCKSAAYFQNTFR